MEKTSLGEHPEAGASNTELEDNLLISKRFGIVPDGRQLCEPKSMCPHVFRFRKHQGLSLKLLLLYENIKRMNLERSLMIRL